MIFRLLLIPPTTPTRQTRGHTSWGRPLKPSQYFIFASHTAEHNKFYTAEFQVFRVIIKIKIPNHLLLIKVNCRVNGLSHLFSAAGPVRKNPFVHSMGWAMSTVGRMRTLGWERTQKNGGARHNKRWQMWELRWRDARLFRSTYLCSEEIRRHT